MRTPSVTEGLGFINYAWPDLGIRIMVERYSIDGSAEIRFFSRDGSAEDLLVPPTRLSLLSQNAISVLIKNLEKKTADIPWNDILTQLTEKMLDIARRGEPVIEIWPHEDDTLSPSYLVEPFLYINHPTVVFGDYGSCKSLFALVIIYIAQLPYSDNTFGMIPRKVPTRCLYLDYEDDQNSFRKRWSCLDRGFGRGDMPITYKRMTTPLADSVEQVKRAVDKCEAELLIVDSLGPAARGNLNDPEPAIRYHAALREIGITSLTLAHCAKESLSKKRTIFGSVFFTNLARSVWECKAEQESGGNETFVSLKQTKANLSKLHPTLGYKFTFSESSIELSKVDLLETNLSGQLPLTLRILNLLKSEPLTAREIAEELDAATESVGVTLNRMLKNKSVVHLPEYKWGLPYTV
jgi:hypothetical protein